MNRHCNICYDGSGSYAVHFFTTRNTVCCRQLGLDLVPRRELSMVDPDEISVTELYRLVSGLRVSAVVSNLMQKFVLENVTVWTNGCR